MPVECGPGRPAPPGQLRRPAAVGTANPGYGTHRPKGATKLCRSSRNRRATIGRARLLPASENVIWRQNIALRRRPAGLPFPAIRRNLEGVPGMPAQMLNQTTECRRFRFGFNLFVCAVYMKVHISVVPAWEKQSSGNRRIVLVSHGRVRTHTHLGPPALFNLFIPDMVPGAGIEPARSKIEGF